MRIFIRYLYCDAKCLIKFYSRSLRTLNRNNPEFILHHSKFCYVNSLHSHVNLLQNHVNSLHSHVNVFHSHVNSFHTHVNLLQSLKETVVHKYSSVPCKPQNWDYSLETEPYFLKNESCSQLPKDSLSKSVERILPDSQIQNIAKISNTAHKNKKYQEEVSSALQASSINVEKKSPKRLFFLKYFLQKFEKYLKKFQDSVADVIPDTAVRFLRKFKNGFKEFVIDFRDYIGVRIRLSLPFYDLENLTRRELELYFHMPRNIVKVFPVIAISSLPLAQNVVLPIAYMFPKHLLCYQFWDEKQRLQFRIETLASRLYNARPTFRCLQTRVDEIKDKDLRKNCQEIFFRLGSGIQPTLDQIMAVNPLFSGEPFQLRLLFREHVNALLRLHDRSVWLRRRTRLREHARLLHCLDLAAYKEGLDKLSAEQVNNMLIFRGVNPEGLTEEERKLFLADWISLSTKLEADSYSLLLHLPLFLAYNHPSNMGLIKI